MSSRLALCLRAPQEWIAEVTVPLPALGNRQQRWTCGDFLGHVARLSNALPNAPYAINLCENRYLFMVAFCAAIVREQTNLLPQNRALGTQQQLFDSYPQAYVLHDGLSGMADSCAQLNINQLNLLGEPATSIPQVDEYFLAALAFTSGSTGQPKPNRKYWRTFVDSSQINARHMLPGGAQAHVHYGLATVPAQHMWGLETSVLLPLFAPLCIADSKPLFPQDVHNALVHLPEPRLLVSTPVHLRALTASGLVWPKVARVLCATAPLPAPLAETVEQAFTGDLVEVFGCSEVGSMACRRRVREEDWQLFDGLGLVAVPVAYDAAMPNMVTENFRVEAAHLPESVVLQDRIEFVASGHFRLLGRSEDMLEIAGKRGSLQEINTLLLTAPGVLDGVVFVPDGDEQAKAQRPVALAVIDTEVTNKAALLTHFAQYLDPAFVPRPIYLVARLPREENGKLRRSQLLALWAELKGRAGDK